MVDTPKPKKVDRRIQRTRNLLRDALMHLIIEKGYDEITIQHITDEANVARTTFYLHFKDKDDLLFQTMRDMYEDLYAQSSFAEMSTHPPQLVEEECDATDFEHVADLAEFYKVMLGERGSAAFLMRVREFLAKGVMEDTFSKATNDEQANLPVEFVAYAVAGARIATIKWWLDHDMPYSPQRMAYMMDQLFVHGIYWGLGLEERGDTEEE